MKVSVELFGAFKKYPIPGHVLELEVPSGVSVQELKSEVISKLTESILNFSEQSLVHDSVLANDHRVLQTHDQITETGKVAILPPVCGG